MGELEQRFFKMIFIPHVVIGDLCNKWCSNLISKPDPMLLWRQALLLIYPFNWQFVFETVSNFF